MTQEVENGNLAEALRGERETLQEEMARIRQLVKEKEADLP